MKTFPALLLLLWAAAPSSAFPFGRDRDGKAAALLSGMRASSLAGDCRSVLEGAPALFAEKPPAPMREEAYRYMGACHEASGAADKAIGVYTLALGLFPENAYFAGRLAAVYVAAGFYSNAVPLFNKVLALRDDDTEANLGLARSYAALGFLARAKERYSRAVILQDFGDAAVLEEYARCMLRKRDWGEVLYIASKGAEAKPGSSFWKLAEARVWAGRGDYARAAAALDAGLQAENLRSLRLEKAAYLLLGGRAAEAVSAAERELSADPKDAAAGLVKGMGLYALGRKAEAGGYFAAARCGGSFTAGLAGAFTPGEGEPKCEN